MQSHLHLISEHQYAYAQNSSTTVALIKAVDSWKLAIDRGEKVVSVFLDLRKAFDVIDHNILLEKMENRGITSNELKWFYSYLNDRYQLVPSGGKVSSKRLIIHGVPQGSGLGPTLFNIHINDIFKFVGALTFFLYADDTEIHASSMDIDEAECSVNEDLARVSDWWRQNGLISNHKKCEVILIGTRNTVATSRDLQIFLDGKQLRQTNSFLGIRIFVRYPKEFIQS